MFGISPAVAPGRLRRRGDRLAAIPDDPFPLDRRGRAKLPLKREVSRVTMIGGIALATAVGAAIRVWVPHGLSLDEIRDVSGGHGSLGEVIHRLAHGGARPPLHPVLEWAVLHLFGGGDFAVRLPSLIAGTAVIPAVGWLARALYDRRTAIVAAVFACVAPILVWYSQEASSYVLVALFGTLAMVGVVRAITFGRPQDWALHVVAASLAVWADWSGIVIVLATEIVLLVTVIGRRRAREPMRALLGGWMLDTLALAVQLVPLAILFAQQLRTGGGLTGVAGVGASGVSFYTTVSNVSWALFGFHPGAVTGVLSALWPLVMLASLVTVGRGLDRKSWMLIVAALVPACALLVIGLTVPAAFDVRYMVAAVPFTLALLARIATRWPRGAVGRSLVAAGCAAVLVAALVDQQVNQNNPRRYDYAAALSWVQRRAGRSDAVRYIPHGLRVVLAHDAPGLRASPLSTHLPLRTAARGVFVISSFSNQPASQALLNREIGALRATRRLVRFHRYPGVSVWWFR